MEQVWTDISWITSPLPWINRQLHSLCYSQVQGHLLLVIKGHCPQKAKNERRCGQGKVNWGKPLKPESRTAGKNSKVSSEIQTLHNNKNRQVKKLGQHILLSYILVGAAPHKGDNQGFPALDFHQVKDLTNISCQSWALTNTGVGAPMPCAARSLRVIFDSLKS